MKATVLKLILFGFLILPAGYAAADVSAVLKPDRSEPDSGPDKGPVFITAEISSRDVYVDEITIYALKLYRQTRVTDISLDLPEMEHISFKKLAEPREYSSQYGGRSYQVLEARYAVLPSKEGAYTIGPSRMNMTVMPSDNRSPSGRFFNDPFFSFSSGRPATLATAPLELKVRPLPRQERPPDFSGLVGDFKIESKLEPAEIKTGESAMLIVEISGQGNAGRIPDLQPPLLEHTKLYADQPVLQVVQNEKGLGGTKTMKWALVPEKAGTLEIPSLRLSFFNPATEKYTILQTSAHTLSVLPGKEQKLISSAAPLDPKISANIVKQEIKELGKDILPIHTALSNLSVSYRPVRPGGLFWLFLIGPCLVYVAAFCLLKLCRRSPQVLAQTRSGKAAKDFIERCRRVGMSPAELITAVRDYLNRRFNLSIGVLTSEEAAAILLSKGVSGDAAENLRVLIRMLEDAVYTGRGHEMTDMARDLLAVVRTIEKEIR